MAGGGWGRGEREKPRMVARVLSRSVASTLCDSTDSARQAPLRTGLSSKNARVGCSALPQGVFPTQGSSLCLSDWQDLRVFCGQGRRGREVPAEHARRGPWLPGAGSSGSSPRTGGTGPGSLRALSLTGARGRGAPQGRGWTAGPAGSPAARPRGRGGGAASPPFSLPPWPIPIQGSRGWWLSGS